MFKKVLCIMLSTLMISGCCKTITQTKVTALSESSIQKEATKKVYSSATIDDDFEPDSVIVVLNKESGAINKVHSKEKFKGVEIEDIRDLTKITGDIKSKNIDEENYQQILQIMLKEKTKKEVLKAIKAFEKIEEVEYVGPNYNETIETVDETIESTTPNDSSYNQQYALTKISAPAAWDITKGTRTVKVGVIDSGISNHPDLNANLTTGWDFYHDNAITTDDTNGHGTHVAGIIGAVGNNSLGVSGVCWNVTLVPLQVYNPTSDKFSGSAIISAITYATNNQIPILNLSGGGTYDNYEMEIAIQNYPGLFVCSAGNDSLDTEVNPHYPSNYRFDNLISVAATTQYDVLSSFSNYGAETVDLAAPGSWIYNTVPGNSYANKSGTSMAAPAVAGVAALIKSIRSDFTAAKIKNCILQGVDKLDSLEGLCVTEGRLNAYKAVSLALDYSIVTGDFKGNGKDQILRLTPISSTTEDAYKKIALHITSNDGSTSIWGKYVQYNGAKVSGRIVAGDFNGDGKDDVATMYDYSDNRPKIHVFKSNGNSFGDYETWFTSTGTFIPNSVSQRFTAGDFNGDGKDDIAAMYDYADNTMKILVFISTGTSFNYWTSWYTESTPGHYLAESVTGRFAAGDYNNDGKDDIAAMYAYSSGATRIHVFKSNGSSFGNYETWYTQNTPGYYKTEKVIDRFAAGDYNNDGKDDIATMYDYGDKTMQIHVFSSTGTTFNNWQAWRVHSTAGSYDPSRTSGFVAGDINGDGNSDIISKYNYANGPTHLLYFRSNGTEFLTWQKITQ